MNTSALVFTSPLPHQHLPLQEWPRSHSRSQTDPLLTASAAASASASTLRPENLHEARLSLDAAPKSPSPPTFRSENSPASLSSSKPPKRKKRSTTLSSNSSRKSHQPKHPALPRSPSVPAFHSKPDSRDPKSTFSIPPLESLPPIVTTPPLLRALSNASTTDSRSPSHKRAPASHSSYGVETTNGPPPSFTTQRTLSQDRLWKPSPPELPTVVPRLNPATFYDELDSPPPKMDELLKTPEPNSSQEDLESTSTAKRRVDEHLHPPNDETNARSTEHAPQASSASGKELVLRPNTPSASEGSKNLESDDRKSEDLFLNIAQQHTGQEIPVRSANRQSRIGRFQASSIARVSNDHPSQITSSPEQDHRNDSTPSPASEVPYQSARRLSLGLRSPAASAHPLDDSGRQRYFSSGSRMYSRSTQNAIVRADRDTSPDLSDNNGHRSNPTDITARSYRRSNLSVFRADRTASTSIPTETQERLRPLEQSLTQVEGTDSTMSTTAPSTVWDELDELKSRIRKLELTGKLPASSAAAMSTVERPQTATTTITTLSSSTKPGRRGTSPPTESAIDGVSASVHPLLHEALRKARPVVSAEVYQKLETTASDALQLVSMMGTSYPSGSASANSVSSSTERQLRRRADSMCQGLTELTIALSTEPRSPTLLPTLRPSSREASQAWTQTPPKTSYSVDSALRRNRRLSHEPDESHLSSSSRVQSRLQSRRASLNQHNIIVNPPQDFTAATEVRTPSSVQSQPQMQPMSSSRLNRAATRLRSLRAPGAIDGADDSENEQSPSVRPVSRARTDVSLRHRSARDRTSLGREYTSSHPLPSFVRKADGAAGQRSPSVVASSGVSMRGPFASSRSTGGSSNVQSPATPRESIQPGYRRYVSSQGVGRDSSPYLSSTEHTPENVTVQRGSASGSRRSLGLTSRLSHVGSFVNGRLRAAKAERDRQEGLPEQEKVAMLRTSRVELADDRENAGVY